MILKKSIYKFLFLILCISPVTFSQVEWRLNSEVGLFRSSGYGILREETLLTRLDGFIKYKFEDDKRTASLSLRGRPEFYGSDNPINSIKVKGEADYFQVQKNFNWGINLSRQRNFFNNINYDFTYDVFTLVGDLSWFISDITTLNTSGGYAFQTIKGNEEYNLNLFFADIKFVSPIVSNIKFGYGFYAERFFIKNEIDRESMPEEFKNDGLRVGPQLSFNYLQDLIFNVDYRMLMHKSEFVDNLSYEHWIRVVAGKIFFDNWSAFLLIDYNSFSFKKAENYIEGVTPLYTPLNLENRIYIKLAYEISSSFELYTKGGYFKDNLYEDTFSLEGWNALIGIELSGGI